MLDRAVLSVLGLFAGVLASTVTPARGQNEGQRYFRNAGWTVESLVAAVLIWTIASGIERADAQTNTSLFSRATIGRSRLCFQTDSVPFALQPQGRWTVGRLP